MHIYILQHINYIVVNILIIEQVSLSENLSYKHWFKGVICQPHIKIIYIYSTILNILLYML